MRLAEVLDRMVDGMGEHAADGEHNVGRAMLATPGGKALDALVEAAVAWRQSWDYEPDMKSLDALAPEDAALYRAADAWTALGDET